MIVDKKSFYEAFVRNNYYMPKYSESCITIKFLRGVRDGKNFMPKTDMITKKQVADPPSKKVVAAELARVLK